jgi:hypothetical protein
MVALRQRRAPLAALLLGLSTSGCSCDSSGGDPYGRSGPIELTALQNADFFPAQFRTVMMRGAAPQPPVAGNTLDGFEAALAQGVRFVEADFHLSLDRQLVASHDRDLGGSCGDVARRTLAELRSCRLAEGHRIATLGDLLSMPFEEIYVDLKETARADDAHVVATVQRAIAELEAAHRKDSAVLMLYRVTDEAARLIREHGVRAGTKGYPQNADQARALIDLAASHGMEMTCMSASVLTPELVTYAARRGVWQLPWDYSRTSNVPHWQALARAGIGGLIVTNRRLVMEQVEPHWRDVRALLR